IPALSDLHLLFEEFRALISDRRPAALLAPRLDAAYLYASSAAAERALRTVSLEISFMFHEANRWHRHFGRGETTNMLCYWGSVATERLARLGLLPQGHAVTGLHLLDYCVAAARDRGAITPRRTQYWSALGVPDVEGPVVVMASHFGGMNPMVDVDF